MAHCKRRARLVILEMVTGRAPNGTMCPSEVARKLVKTEDGARALDWRSAMPVVHAAVDELVDEGHVRLSWKGRSLATRAGPYRIAATAPGVQSD